MFLPVVLVLLAENVGHVTSVGLMTGRNLDHMVGRTLASDGIATALSAGFGGSPTTTYGENIGVMSATRVYSTAEIGRAPCRERVTVEECVVALQETMDNAD